jgi:hypothetical protein
MVLNFLQVPASYDRLIKLLRIGPAGAPFRNLHYLSSMGVSVSIEQGEIDTLQAYLHQGLPPIAFVATAQLSYWNEATSHAVVICGIENDLIYLNDPDFADSPKILAVAEFELAWLEMDQFFAIIQPK